MVLSIRDPIHGFIRADPLEAALINSSPVQRLRSVHQLGFTYLIFPGAEHSRFSHALGAMELAGRVYDHLAAKSDHLLPPGPRSGARRLVRVAALLHDIGHAPFSHSAEDLFEEAIDHEEMTRRLLQTEEIRQIFAEHGDGVGPEEICRVLTGEGDDTERLLTQIISGDLDVDKMDYLLRDSLFCGVRYGSYDLERLLDTIRPIADPESDRWILGVDHGGVHSLEALVLARYYMFTQVYFDVTVKALELHFTEWLKEEDKLWPARPEDFLEEDDVTVLSVMRRSQSSHAAAVVRRAHYRLAFQTGEHLSAEDKDRFESLLPSLRRRFGSEKLLVSNSAKDPHRLGKSRVLVRSYDGRLEPMEDVSQFIRHLKRIDCYRIYTPAELRNEVAECVSSAFG